MTGGRRQPPAERIQPYLPESLVKRLRAASNRLGLSVSLAIRTAVEEWLERYGGE